MKSRISGIPIDSKSVLDWLLERDNPPVRYLTLLRLLGKDPQDTEVTVARREMLEYEPVRESLQKLLDVPVVEPVDLSVLATLGLSREEPAVDNVCQRVMNGQIQPQPGYGCYIGHILGSLIRFGYMGDPRLDSLITAILREQRFLDGNRPGTELRYGRLSSVCAGSHSCFSAVVWSLWAMAAIPPHLRTPEIEEFVARGAAFLRTHRLYKANHSGFRPIRSEWLKLQLPTGLGWRVDVLHILEVAGQIGLSKDLASADAVTFILSRRGADGRWPLDVRNPDRTRCCASLWKEETVGQPSKWVTMAATVQLKRFCSIAAGAETDHADDPVRSSDSQYRFAPYPFAYASSKEDEVRQSWANARMEYALEAILGFARKTRLRTGWQHGLVIGPQWCREWCAARVSWVPRPRFEKAWPVCRMYFIAGRKQFTIQALSKRLGIPDEDREERSRFPALYRHAFWRIRIAPWTDQYDEIAVSLRSVEEVSNALSLLGESLRFLRKKHAAGRR